VPPIRGIICAVRGAARCGRDEPPAAFFAGLLNAGDAINAPAATQLTKTNPVFFMNFSSFGFPCPNPVPELSGITVMGAPEFRLWKERDVLLIRDCIAVRMR
jgi:hypothetical protein